MALKWLAAHLGGAETNHRVLISTGWLYLDQIVRAVATLVGFSLVTRSLGPENYGHLSYAMAFPGVFLPLAALGLDYVVVRDFVRHPSEREKILATALALKVLACGLAFLLALASSMVVPADPAARSLLAVTSLSLLFQPLLTLDYYFQSQVSAKAPAIARMTACIIANGVRAWLFWRGAPLAWFAWTIVVETAVYSANLVLAWRVVGVRWSAPWRAFDSVIARRLFESAWPLLLADVAMVFFLKIDQLLLSQLAGAEALGKYAAAFRLAEAAGFLAIAFINSQFPHIVAEHQTNREAFDAGVHRFFIRITWLAVGVAILTSAASPLVASLALGDSFGRTWPVLVVLVWANVFVAQIAVRGKWFLVETLQSYSLTFFVIGAAMHLSLICVFAPRWGAMGAAVSFAATQAVMALVAPALFARSRPAARVAFQSLLGRLRYKRI